MFINFVIWLKFFKLKPAQALDIIQNIEKTINRRASGSGTVGLSSPKNSTESNEENNEPQFQKLNNINSVELQYYQLIISIVSKIFMIAYLKYNGTEKLE